MSMIPFHTHPDTAAPALEVQLSTEERLYQLAADHDESRVFAVYAAVTRHLRGGGQHRLSNQMVADMTPGCGVGKARDCLALLCEAGLLAREGNANSAYFYRLPSPTPPLRVVQQAPPHVQRCTPHVASLEEEKEELSIDGEGEKSLITPTTSDNEQTRIARRYVRDEEVIAIAAELPPKTVKYIAQKADEAKTSRGGYFAQAVRNAPVEAPRTKPKPPAKSRIPVPGRDDAPAPVAAPPVAITPPSGPIIAPEPRPLPPPPAAEDPTVTRAHAALVAAYARTCTPISAATLTRDGDAWTLHTPPDAADRISAMHRYLYATLRDTAGATDLTITTTQEPQS